MARNIVFFVLLGLCCGLLGVRAQEAPSKKITYPLRTLGRCTYTSLTLRLKYSCNSRTPCRCRVPWHIALIHDSPLMRAANYRQGTVQDPECLALRADNATCPSGSVTAPSVPAGAVHPIFYNPATWEAIPENTSAPTVERCCPK